MLFYIFFLVFYLSRYFWVAVSIWVAATVINAISGFSNNIEIALIKMYLNPLILEFVAGMIAALLYSRLSPKVWALPTLLGISLAIGFFVIGDGHRALFGLSLSPLVLGLALAETRFKFRIPAPALLLGGASYAIYLVHNPVQSLVARLVGRVDSWFTTFAVCCLAGVLIGIAYHVYFEKPALKFIGSRMKWRFNSVVALD